MFEKKGKGKIIPDEREEVEESDVDLEELPLYSHEDNKWLEAAMDFDQKNIPEVHSNLELDEIETLSTIFKMMDKAAQKEKRAKPHERTVLLFEQEDQRSVIEIYHMNPDELERGGKNEPQIALVDSENNIRGKAPFHTFAEKTGIDKIIESIEKGELSITYAGLPEASYHLLEDSMERGRVAYAGTINGEAEYSCNRDVRLTISNFMSSDNVHVFETAYSGEKEAVLQENKEEENDRGIGFNGRMIEEYSGDYRGWSDPDYQPDDDMERDFDW